MDKKDRIIIESVLYLAVNVLLIFIMFVLSLFFLWDIDYEMIFDIRRTSLERIYGLRFMWSVLFYIPQNYRICPFPFTTYL